MIRETVNQLHTDHFCGARDGDTIVFYQTHANGSDDVVARIELRGDEIDDAVYLLTKAQKRRKLEKEMRD